ncbi:hypothetical protein NPIL_545151 [Nephila pilipes]|uniref:Uncharacterized protein n=1 Tax=Nephila pilipes TaxID=299642 RepID=A0A8X6QR12_NEPPI|nr:hypothetical protein NPIL_545151 [Nephila pilipes]
MVFALKIRNLGQDYNQNSAFAERIQSSNNTTCFAAIAVKFRYNGEATNEKGSEIKENHQIVIYLQRIFRATLLRRNLTDFPTFHLRNTNVVLSVRWGMSMLLDFARIR